MDVSLGFRCRSEVSLFQESQGSTSSVGSERARVRQRDEASARAQLKRSVGSRGGRTDRSS